MTDFSISYPYLCEILTVNMKLLTQEIARQKLLIDVKSQRGSPRQLDWNQSMRLQVYLYLRRAGVEPTLAAEAALFVRDYAEHFSPFDVPACNAHTQRQTYLSAFDKTLLLIKLSAMPVGIERPSIADVQSYDFLTASRLSPGSAAYVVPLHSCAAKCAEVYHREHKRFLNAG